MHEILFCLVKSIRYVIWSINLLLTNLQSFWGTQRYLKTFWLSESSALECCFEAFETLALPLVFAQLYSFRVHMKITVFESTPCQSISVSTPMSNLLQHRKLRCDSAPGITIALKLPKLAQWLWVWLCHLWGGAAFFLIASRKHSPFSLSMTYGLFPLLVSHALSVQKWHMSGSDKIAILSFFSFWNCVPDLLFYIVVTLYILYQRWPNLLNVKAPDNKL